MIKKIFVYLSIVIGCLLVYYVATFPQVFVLNKRCYACGHRLQRIGSLLRRDEIKIPSFCMDASRNIFFDDTSKDGSDEKLLLQCPYIDNRQAKVGGVSDDVRQYLLSADTYTLFNDPQIQSAQFDSAPLIFNTPKMHLIHSVKNNFVLLRNGDVIEIIEPYDSCRGLLQILNTKFSYPPKVYDVLIEIAKTIDTVPPARAIVSTRSRILQE